MAEGQDWVTPRLNGEPWLEKPILFYWAAASGYRLFGDGELAPRLPSAISALLTALALGWMGWRLYGTTTAAVVLIVFPTTVSTFAFARGATTDMLFTALLALTMMAAARLVVEPGNRPRLWQVAFGAALGLAVLAKGPAGILLTVGGLAFWGVASHRMSRLTALARPLVWVSFGVGGAPLVCHLGDPNPRVRRRVSDQPQPRSVSDPGLPTRAAVLVLWTDSRTGPRTVVGLPVPGHPAGLDSAANR